MGGMAYMCKNRHGMFYARFIIPKHLRPHFNNKKEIRRSLRTDSRKLAVKRARVYRVEFESIVDKLMSKNEYSAYQVTLEGVTVATLPNGEKKTITGKIERNLTEGEDTTHHKQYLLNQLREEAKREEEASGRQQRERRANELHQAQLAALSHSQTVAPQPTGEKISQHLDDYIAHKLTPGKKRSWSEGTARQKPNKLKVFRSIFGDKPTAALTREDMEHYIKVAYKIPANFENTENPKYKKFKGITLDMVLNDAPEFESIDYTVRSEGTVKEDLKTIKAFLRWVSKHKDVVLQIPMNALGNVISDIDYESTKRPFSDRELKTLFEDDNPASENYVKGFSKPISFWLPLIALYTGARQAEICQLHLADIKLVKALSSDTEHWCIDINEEDDKNLKTKFSVRQIPIHENLLNAGLLIHVDGLRANGETKLFPDTFRASGQFAALSAWFGYYSGKAGITDKNTSFHSFRHNFSTYLTVHHIPEELVTALSGHRDKSLAKSLYGKSGKRDVGKLAEVINSIDYGLTHPEWKIY